MPKSHRDFLKRSVAQAATHIESAQIDLLQVKEQFNGVHPELALLLDGVVGALETTLGFIVSFCVQCWGTAPEEWFHWRNPGTHDPVSLEEASTPEKE